MKVIPMSCVEVLPKLLRFFDRYGIGQSPKTFWVYRWEFVEGFV